MEQGNQAGNEEISVGQIRKNHRIHIINWAKVCSGSVGLVKVSNDSLGHRALWVQFSPS